MSIDQEVIDTVLDAAKNFVLWFDEDLKDGTAEIKKGSTFATYCRLSAAVDHLKFLERMED